MQVRAKAASQAMGLALASLWFSNKIQVPAGQHKGRKENIKQVTQKNQSC